MNRKYRKTVIAGNWKMNLTASEIKPFMEQLKPLLPKSRPCDVVLCTPAVMLPAMIKAGKDAKVAAGGQDVSKYEKGAYTGVTNVVVKAVAFLTTLFIVGIVLALLGGITDLLGKIPCVDKVNAIVGAMAGGLIGLVIVWVIFAVATMLSATVFGQKILTLISENPLLSFIYNHNYITTRILS